MANNNHTKPGFDSKHNNAACGIILTIVGGVLVWAIILSAALVLLLGCSANAQTIITRDWAGREVLTTSRHRGSVVTRDRFGREVLTTKREGTKR